MTRNQTGFRLFVAKTPGVWVPVKLHYFDRWGHPTLSFVHYILEFVGSYGLSS